MNAKINQLIQAAYGRGFNQSDDGIYKLGEFTLEVREADCFAQLTFFRDSKNFSLTSFNVSDTENIHLFSVERFDSLLDEILLSYSPKDLQAAEAISFRIQFENEGIVARALVGADQGWLTDNGNVFNTRSTFAAQVYENALVARDDRNPNRVRKFVS